MFFFSDFLFRDQSDEFKPTTGVIISSMTYWGIKKEDEYKILMYKLFQDIEQRITWDIRFSAQHPEMIEKVGLDKAHKAYESFRRVLYANLLVFGAWVTWSDSKLFSKYFLSVPAETRVLPHLLAIFSHSDFLHLFFNMSALMTLGPQVGSEIGTEHALSLLIGGGVFASNASVWVTRLFLKSKMYTGSLGASVSSFETFLALRAKIFL